MKKYEHSAKGLTPVFEAIRPLTKKVLGKHGFAEVDILTNWEQIVGEELASFCLPLKLDNKKKTLSISTAGGAFALELKQRQNIILEKINSFLGFNAVTDLKIIQNSHNISAAQKPQENKHKKLVTAEQQNYIDNLVKDVDNQELKNILTKLGQDILTD